MKRYIRAATSSYMYRGFTIYYDGRDYYIYRGDRGTERMDFSSDVDAEEWVDSFIEDHED